MNFFYSYRVLIYTRSIYFCIQEEFNDKSQYTIMFGPDKCGEDAKVIIFAVPSTPITGYSLLQFFALY